MTAGRSIDYDALTQDALRGLVRTVLEQVAKSGLPGDHHFYIAFDTQAPGVGLSRRLKEKYPDEMMIVLQHRFWDLLVSEDGFEIKLTFDGIPERLVVPFQALRVFFDPSVRFTLQFGDAAAQEDARDAAAPRRRRRDGDADADASKQNGDRRPRPRVKSRNDRGSDADDAPVPAASSEPAPSAPASLSPPRPVEPFARPVAVPTVAPSAAATSKPAAEPAAPQQPSGAKVFSLDQFRKK